MKINDITETTSGGIAVVAQPIGGMIKRPNPSVFSKNKKKKTEDVTKGNFGGQTDVPQLPHQEVLMAISSWEYGDTPIELSNGYVINAYEEGASADDNAWIVLDPQGNEYDSGTGSIVDIMQEFTSKLIDEGKSPHKKGTKKYKKHMAAMHAEEATEEVDEVAGAKDCWDGYKKDGTQPGTGKNKGKRVNKCVKEDESGMIGEPDRYYDAEDRTEAYNELQDALEQCDSHERDYVMDGSCPACAGSGYMDGEETFINDDGEEEESSECDGFGNYGCDEGEMTYGNDTVKWKQIMDHDYNQEIKRERESKPQPSDEILVGAMKQLHKNYVETGRFNAMELPRILRQMYPEISKQKAREIGSKFFHKFRDMNDEMSEDYNPALVTMLAKFEDECAHYYRYYGDTDMITIDKLLKAGKAEEAAEEMAGAMSDSSGGSNDFDHIYDFAKDLVDDYLHEPAMAEMRKLAGLPETEVKERTYKDVGTADMVKDRRGKEFKFHKDAKQFKSVDGEVAGLNTKLGKDLLRIRRNQMKRTTPSYPGNK